MDFDTYKANHLKDVEAGRVMQLPDYTLRKRAAGDWSGGLNASEMFRNQDNTINRAPPSLYSSAPSSVASPMERRVTTQPVGQPTTFTGDTGPNSTGPIDPNPTNPAAVSGMTPDTAWWDKGNTDSYDSYIDRSFSHAMRTLDPMIQQNEDRFSQSMIDKGFDTGSEGYQKAYDNNSRRYNDLASAAAYNAMNFGANRMDADRNYALGELATIDNMNRAWDAIGYRNAAFNTSQEDQRFNQMLSLFGMTPVGTTVPTNVGANVANSVNAQTNALNAQNALYSNAAGAVGDAIGAVDWGSIFNGWGFGGNTTSSSAGRSPSRTTGGMY